MKASPINKQYSVENIKTHINNNNKEQDMFMKYYASGGVILCRMVIINTQSMVDVIWKWFAEEMCIPDMNGEPCTFHVYMKIYRQVCEETNRRTDIP